MKKIILATLLIVLVSSSVGLAQRVKPGKFAEAPDGKVFVYKKEGDQSREIEVYFPKEKSDKPVAGIVMFHGGGWAGGTREQFKYLCNYFASRGLVAATVTYKLAKNSQGLKPGQSRKRICIPDAKSAIRWFKQNAKKFNVDPEKIITGGGSAGGHICLIATTTPGLNDPNDPEGIDTSVAAYLLFNPALSVGDAKDPAIDFQTQLTKDIAPGIAFWGSKDLNWLEGWTPASKKWKSFKDTTLEVKIAEGKHHAFFNRQPWRDLTIIQADRFLKSLGLIEGEPTLTEPTDAKLIDQK